MPGSAPFWITRRSRREHVVHRTHGEPDRQDHSGGRHHRVPVPTAGSQPGEITAGPDGALWFTEQIRQPDRTDHHRSGRSPSSPCLESSSGPIGITAGPDGAVVVHRADRGTGSGGSRPPDSSPSSRWCSRTANRPTSPPGLTATYGSLSACGNAVGRITPGGSIDEFVVPASTPNLVGIAAGPDGNVWFAELGGNNIGRVTAGRDDHRIPPSQPELPAVRDRPRDRRRDVVHRAERQPDRAHRGAGGPSAGHHASHDLDHEPGGWRRVLGRTGRAG